MAVAWSTCCRWGQRLLTKHCVGQPTCGAFATVRGLCIASLHVLLLLWSFRVATCCGNATPAINVSGTGRDLIFETVNSYESDMSLS